MFQRYLNFYKFSKLLAHPIKYKWFQKRTYIKTWTYLFFMYELSLSSLFYLRLIRYSLKKIYFFSQIYYSRNCQSALCEAMLYLQLTVIKGSTTSIAMEFFSVSNQLPPNILAKYGLWQRYILWSKNSSPSAFTLMSLFRPSLKRAWYIYCAVLSTFFL